MVCKTAKIRRPGRGREPVKDDFVGLRVTRSTKREMLRAAERFDLSLTAYITLLHSWAMEKAR